MPRVLKAATVHVDKDNTVQIKADIPNIAFLHPEQDVVEEPDARIQSEQMAKDTMQKAEDQAAFTLRRAEIESNELISNARESSEAMIAEAEARNQAEGRRIREESEQEGYKEGMDKATKEGESIRAKAQKTLDDAIKERDEMRAAVEPEAVNLIINIVEKLVGNVVDINPAVVVHLIRQGFAGVATSSQGGRITVRVSEADYDEVIAHKDDVAASIGGMAELEIVKDFYLNATDCVIDTPIGGIDVSLTPQLEALKNNLIFLLEHPV